MPPGIGIAEHAELQIDSFHDLILSNDTEIFEKSFQAVHVDELDQTNHCDEAEIRKEAAAAALGATPHSVPGLIYSAFFGWLSWAHEIWLNLCAAIVTLYTLSVVGYCCLPTGVTAPVQRIMRIGKNTRRQQQWMEEDDAAVERQAPIIRPIPRLSRAKSSTFEPRVRFQRSGNSECVTIEAPENERVDSDEVRIPQRNVRVSRSNRVQSWADMFHQPENPQNNSEQS